MKKTFLIGRRKIGSNYPPLIIPELELTIMVH